MKNKNIIFILVLIAAIGLISYYALKTKPASLEYKNSQYGFSFDLPLSWQGYTIVESVWQGHIPGETGDIFSEEGPLISVRHPLWTEEKPRQDIPIMVFTIDQWDKVIADDLFVSAAPIPPMELGRNQNYVFALPARYNFAFPEGFEEVEQIIAAHPLRAFDK
ncbi:MAG TPA: hypothetical protein PLN18_01210 [Candidatus Colwellbacteria bacterium]|nr:hypothetical protein [Candidatus Colwellbacteria bacterium]HQA95973.1 hypothetical protein [Candidatus Colwellbacteria bacterium]